MSAHTPGPWKVSDSGQHVLATRVQHEGPIAVVASTYWMDGAPEEAAANIRLAAAAPDLEICLAETAGMLSACIDIAGGRRASPEAVQHLRDQHAKCLAVLAKAGAAP